MFRTSLGDLIVFTWILHYYGIVERDSASKVHHAALAMANDPRSSPSNFPASMGPGARPNKPGEGDETRTRLMQVIQARSKYQVNVESETLSLSYELNESPRMYRLPFDTIPLQGLSRWWLYGGHQRARKAGILAIDIIRGSENMVQRPVTQQEAEALTYWTGQRVLYGSYATAIGCALGTYLARRGHIKMKFPILAAKPLEQYNHFPVKSIPILTGQTAQGAWQVFRYSVWIQVAFLVSTPVVGTVGTLYATKGLANDSRTQGLAHALKERSKGDAGGIEWPQQHGQSPSSVDTRNRQNSGQESQSDFDMEQGGHGGQTMARGQSMGQASEDSNKRQSYSLGETFEQGSASDTGTLSDSAVTDRENKQQYERYPTSQQQQQQQPPPRQIQSSRPSSSADSESFFYDDASPTAGNDPDNATPQAYSQPSGGSAWDRVRRGGSAPPRPQPQQQSSRAREARSSRQAEAEAESNEYKAYSNEARQSSGDRGRAQREFDEMLEKERQQSGSGEYDRGMRAVEQGEEGRHSSGGGGSGSAWETRRRGSE